MRIEGVVTTGIYCRSDCVAQPRPENTRGYVSTIAAEAAGFRPCLRCRPERLPPRAVDGVPNPVAIALVLVADGFLDHHVEAELAKRALMSVRQLRRLFEAHVGASPDFVARSRRAHFARRLLDETSLPLGEVAFAAGFGSVRQFNRQMQATFRFSPSALRARRRRADVLATDGGLRLRLPYHAPLPAATMLRYLAPRAISGVETVRDGVYRRVIASCGHFGVIEVRDVGDGAHLEVTAHLPTFASLIDDATRVRRLFQLDRDPGRAHTTLAEDEFIGPLVARAPGLRLPAAWDPFETGVRVLLGQQVSVSAASTLAERLVSHYGTPLRSSLPEGLTHLFPPAERLATAHDLREIGIPARRAAALRAFAAAYAQGELELTTRSLDEIRGHLEALPGVGPWSAQMIAARAFGHPDAFAASDLGLRRNAARLVGRDDPLSTGELAELAERWRPHRATAAAYIWTMAPTGSST